MKYKYLGIDITNYENPEDEVQQQVAKANKVASCLSDVIWENKFMEEETKTRVYKMRMGPIMMYIGSKTILGSVKRYSHHVKNECQKRSFRAAMTLESDSHCATEGCF